MVSGTEAGSIPRIVSAAAVLLILGGLFLGERCGICLLGTSSPGIAPERSVPGCGEYYVVGGVLELLAVVC